MLDTNKLKRIYGILSAKEGTQIPKFLSPAGEMNLSAEAILKLLALYLDEGRGTKEEFFRINPNFVPIIQSEKEKAEEADKNNPAYTILSQLILLALLALSVQTAPISGDSTQKSTTPTPTITPVEEPQYGEKPKYIGDYGGDSAPLDGMPLYLKVQTKTDPEEGEGPNGFLGKVAGKINSFADNIDQLKNDEGWNKAAGISAIAGTAVDTISKSFIDKTQYATDDPTQGQGRQAYDAVANSLMNFAPIGTIAGGAMKVAGVANDLLGSKTNEIAVDLQTMNQVGGSYSGSSGNIEEAAGNSGKKYGLLGFGARKKANNKIKDAQILLGRMLEVAREASYRSDASTLLSLANTASLQFQMDGGYDQRYMRAAKAGTKILYFKDPFKASLSDIKIFSVELSDNPTLLKNGGTLLDKLIELNTFKAVLTDAEDLELFKKGGVIKDREIEVIETNTTQKSVIPEGALHKNKHHLDLVGIDDSELTKKGIPVVDNDGDLLAEIELNEIIFTLEVTKELESRYKEFYEEGTSTSKKDELALEAGKLLWKEILYNTDDRTGLINSLKKGGTIDKKEEYKPSFEEWFNSIPENYRANGYDYKLAYDVLDADTLLKHAKDPKKNHLYSVSPKADERGWFPFLKLGREEVNPEINGELSWRNGDSPEAIDHRNSYELVFDLGRYWYVPRKKKLAMGGLITQEDINSMVKQALLNLLK